MKYLRSWLAAVATGTLPRRARRESYALRRTELGKSADTTHQTRAARVLPGVVLRRHHVRITQGACTSQSQRRPSEAEVGTEAATKTRTNWIERGHRHVGGRLPGQVVFGLSKNCQGEPRQCQTLAAFFRRPLPRVPGPCTAVDSVACLEKRLLAIAVRVEAFQLATALAALIRERHGLRHSGPP